MPDGGDVYSNAVGGDLTTTAGSSRPGNHATIAAP
jgi:hypothetical protein